MHITDIKYTWFPCLTCCKDRQRYRNTCTCPSHPSLILPFPQTARRLLGLDPGENIPRSEIRPRRLSHQCQHPTQKYTSNHRHSGLDWWQILVHLCLILSGMSLHSQISNVTPLHTISICFNIYHLINSWKIAPSLCPMILDDKALLAQSFFRPNDILLR